MIKKSLTVLILILVAFFAWHTLFTNPEGDGAVVFVKEGMSTEDIAHNLKENNLIRSSKALKIVLTATGNSDEVLAGEYHFSGPISVLEAFKRLTRGSYNTPTVRLRTIEGSSIFSMADVVSETFPHITPEEFILEARGYEGYLYPDTYILPFNLTVREIVKIMNAEFQNQVAPLSQLFVSSGKSMEDIIKMASIIELESADRDERFYISGILWKRIELNIPLQVDVAFSYVNGKNSYTLTLEDLRKDHPYNTYTNRGLPPTPIGNPGIESIRAALTPKKSEYLYFIADRNGKTHYSRTHEEHVNKKFAFKKE
ncbi:MAG: endolytic transglycosylase MltG [Candidatus Campbellbacteria bacterium]|nr:endolytic transglycosylase MltG [Candidatus Campbellbacteria bacterium]